MRISVPLPLLLLAGLLAGAPTARADDKSVKSADDPALQEQLEAIDAKVRRIKDFTARFRQEKFTALLKKPLVSSGRVRVAGSTIRWDTEQPEPTILFSGGKDVRIYYPGQKLLEVYPIDQRMGDLAASPLPKLATLREHFTLARAPADAFPEADSRKALPLRLVPIEDALKEHLEEVRVLLDIEAAHILELEVIDADGDRTHITFKDVRLDTGIKPADLAFTVPDDTTISRPLEAEDRPGTENDPGK